MRYESLHMFNRSIRKERTEHQKKLDRSRSKYHKIDNIFFSLWYKTYNKLPMVF